MGSIGLSRRLVLGAVGVAWLSGPLAAAPSRLRMRDLYTYGAEFSEEALRLDGRTVEIKGFMAPPLKADAGFFVLTSLPMAVCPFCDSALDWPSDIVLVRLRRRQPWADFNLPIVARGTLQLGTEIEPETGFVSRVRLVEAVYETA